MKTGRKKIIGGFYKLPAKYIHVAGVCCFLSSFAFYASSFVSFIGRIARAFPFPLTKPARLKAQNLAKVICRTHLEKIARYCRAVTTISR